MLLVLFAIFLELRRSCAVDTRFIAIMPVVLRAFNLFPTFCAMDPVTELHIYKSNSSGRSAALSNWPGTRYFL